MTSPLRRLLVGVATACIVSAAPFAQAAEIQGELQAEKLEDQSGIPILQTSLFILVADTANPGNPASVNFTINNSIQGGLSTNVGTVLAPNQLIVYKGDLSGSAGAGVLNAFFHFDANSAVFNGALMVGDRLALLWFPSMTINSATFVAGLNFGFYDGGTATAANQADSDFSAADGGDASTSAWLLPIFNKSGYNPYFYTKDSTVLISGSTVSSAAVAGRATGLILVPEPASAFLVASGALALLGRRRSRA